MSLYHLGNARSERQREDMAALEAAGTCLLCPDGLAADPDQLVVYLTDHWAVTPNEYPYEGALLHLLLVPNEHVTDLVDLSEPARNDFWTALRWVRDRHGLAYYGLAARNGDCRFTGGSIAHVHVHVIVGDPAAEPVRFKRSSRADSGA